MAARIILDPQVLTDDRLQRPPQPAAGQFRPRRCGPAEVLPPHVPAAGAAVAADRDEQRHRPPTPRLMREPAGHAVARYALTAAAPAPPVRLHDPARQDCSSRLQPLADHLKTELVKPAEHRQIRASEGNVRPQTRPRRAAGSTPSSVKSRDSDQEFRGKTLVVLRCTPPRLLYAFRPQD